MNQSLRPSVEAGKGRTKGPLYVHEHELRLMYSAHVIDDERYACGCDVRGRVGNEILNGDYVQYPRLDEHDSTMAA